jgi:hypothetical protein
LAARSWWFPARSIFPIKTILPDRKGKTSAEVRKIQLEPEDGQEAAGIREFVLSTLPFESTSGNESRRPVSRILSRTIIPLGGALLRTLQRPTRRFWRAGPARVCWLAPCRLPAYLVLLRVGFTMPPALQPGAVRSYRTFSPLPQRCRCGGIVSVALAVPEPSRSGPGRYPAHCPAEFGLSSPGEPCGSPAAIAQPPAKSMIDGIGQSTIVCEFAISSRGSLPIRCYDRGT